MVGRLSRVALGVLLLGACTGDDGDVPEPTTALFDVAGDLSTDERFCGQTPIRLLLRNVRDAGQRHHAGTCCGRQRVRMTP